MGGIVMVGALLIFGTLFILLLGIILGLFVLAAFVRQRRQGHGSWGLYAALGIPTFLLTLSLGILTMTVGPEVIEVSRGDDYLFFVFGIPVLAAAPGLGLLMGLFAMPQRGERIGDGVRAD